MGVGFKALLAAWKPVLQQPSDEDIELSAPPASCLLECCYAPALMTMDETSEPVSQPQLNVVLIRIALVMVSVHRSKPLVKHRITLNS